MTSKVFTQQACFQLAPRRSIAQSCPALQTRKADASSRASQARSVTLSETRVQAELAKRRFAQQRAAQEANQKRIDFEREVARQNRELDKRRAEAEARERELKQEAERNQRKLQEEAEARERHAEARERQLQEEAAVRQCQLQEESERRMRELDERQRELQEETELYQT